MEEDELKQTIIDTAKTPTTVQGDAGMVVTRNVDQVISADKHLASKAAGKTRTAGMRIRKFVPPGAAD